MSTKIYYAWRVKINKLNDFIDYVKPQIYDYAEKIIRKLMDNIKEEVLEEKRKQFPVFKDKENIIRFDCTLDVLKKISEGKERYVDLDIDYSLNIWLKGNYFYIIPIGENDHINIKIPNFAEDYSYWNNTDRPDNLNEEEWIKRAKTWDKIIYNHNARRLNHSIIDLSQKYGDIDFEREIENRILGSK